MSVLLWMSLLPAQYLTIVIPCGSQLAGLDIPLNILLLLLAWEALYLWRKPTHLLSSRRNNFPAIFLISLLSVLGGFVFLPITWNPSPFSLQAFFALAAVSIIATGSFPEFFSLSFWALEVGIAYFYWEMICRSLLEIAFSASFERTHWYILSPLKPLFSLYIALMARPHANHVFAVLL